jgi:hypothetical protein
LTTAGGLVALAYPFGDVVIVFFILVAVRRMHGGDRVALWCLLAGLLMMAVSDSTYSYLTTTNSYATGNLVDVGWIAAYLTIGLAAYSSRPALNVTTSTPESDAPTLTAFLAPFVPALLALGVAALELQLGHRLDQAAMLMAFALVGVVLVRQTLIALELTTVTDTEEGHWLTALFRTALGRSPAATSSPSPSRRKAAPS